ncbi:MAG TPA: FecR domain-containing protein [Gemmatimonadales bacterium]|nr:FecR domain-containing protein [Gemmatimonadales bacterium]
MSDHIDDRILERYCSGDCTPGEKAEVERWVAGAPERSEYIRMLRAAWLEAGAIDRPPTSERPDVDNAWSAVAKRIRAANRPVLRLATEAATRAPRSWWLRSLAIAAGLAAVVILGGIIWNRFGTSARGAAPAMAEVATQRGQRANVRLPDGTRIVLGPASRLRYPAAGLKATRRLELDGFAYFEVVHDPARPFSVTTPRGTATDLGTRFAIRAYPVDSAMSVAVADGSVDLASITGSPERLVLSTGDLGRVAVDGRLAVERSANIDRFVGLGEGRLIFHDTPLRDAVVDLSRWYDLDVQLADSSLGQIPLTASFTDEPGAEALRLIAASVHLQQVRNGRVVVLSR